MMTEKPKVDRSAQGRKGSMVTAKRNFRHPTGEPVVVDKYIRMTAFEDEQINRLSKQIGMSAAGIVRMALYLFGEDIEAMSKLAVKYREEVK